MRVILTENIKGLGQTGETAEVKSGYARNFLVPRKLAILATTENLKKVDGLKKQKAEALQESIQKMKGVGEKLKNYRLIIETRADEKGNLYAGVNPKIISGSLKERGIDAESDYIELAADPIKKVGCHQALFKYYDVEARFEVEVVRV